MICRRKGYPLKVVMPDNVTEERTQLLRMYGAEIVYSEGAKGSNGAVELALEMAEGDASYYMPYQYGNEANPKAHYDGTAPEILEELDEVAAFVGGLGTGGTLMGNGRRFKEEDPETKIVAAEPMQGELVQGLRSLDDGFIPPIIDLSLLDRKIMVSNRDAIIWTKKLLRRGGPVRRRLLGRDRLRRRPHRRASSTRATSSSSSPTTAGSTSPPASTRSRSRSSRGSTPPSGGSRSGGDRRAALQRVAVRVRQLAPGYRAPDFAEVRTPDAALFLAAIDHSSGYDEPHMVEGEGPFRGSALLWAQGLAFERRRPGLLSASSLGEIGERELAAIFTVEADRPSRLEERARRSCTG